MRLAHWCALIALLAGLGCLQVGQRNAIILQSYAVGERMQQVHHQETDVSWLSARVTGLASPTRLAEVGQERGLKLVARTMFQPQTPLSRRALAQKPAPADDAAGTPIQLAEHDVTTD